MDGLDSRSQNILLLLLQSDQPLSACDIGAALNLTPRMVRFRMMEIETWLRTRDVHLMKKRSEGYSIKTSPQTRNELILSIKNRTAGPNVVSPIERKQLLLLALLLCEQPLLVKQLQLKLNVSRATVLRDFDDIVQWLASRKLNLIRKPNYGFEIGGEEKNHREAIIDFLLNNVSTEHFFELFSRRHISYVSLQKIKTNLARELSSYFECLDLVDNARIVQELEKKEKISLSDNAYIQLVLTLAIMVHRARKGLWVEIDRNYLDYLTNRPEYRQATYLAVAVQNKFSIILPISETANLAIRLVEADAIKVQTETRDAVPADDPVAAAIKESVDLFLHKASLRLHPSLRVNETLIQHLNQHLVQMSDKLKLGLVIRNPLLDDVKKQYPDVYRIAQESSLSLGERLGVHIPEEEEVGYLAMYLVAALQRLRLSPKPKRILVVCDAGVATAWLLVSRIKAEFQTIEVIGAISLKELKNWRNKDNVDLIVSTVPVNAGPIPSIQVSAFLDKQETLRLKAALEEPPKASPLQKSGSGLISTPNLNDLLTEDTIQLFVAAADWKDAVEKAGSILLDCEAIEPRFISAMIKLIEEYGPYMVTYPGIALLHAQPSDGVRRLCFSLSRLDPPVPFNHPQHDPVDIAIVVGAVDSHSHVKALQQLLSLLENQELLERVRKASFPRDIVRIIKSAAL